MLIIWSLSGCTQAGAQVAEGSLQEPHLAAVQLGNFLPKNDIII